MLSDSDSDAESLHRLTINEHYAKAFEYKKEREELAKLKEKYGSDAGSDDEEDSETDSEDAESEDEDGEELTPAVDAAILRTLAKIKRKDSDIYISENGVFEEEQKKIAPIKVAPHKQKDKAKPVTLRQVALESALNQACRSPSPEPVPHIEEQRALRDETIAAFHHAVNDEEEDEDGLLVLREKTKDEIERDEEEYREFLKKEVGEDLDSLVTVEQDLVGVRSTNEAEGRATKRRKRAGEKENAKDQKEETDQKFLMNYILNRGWIDRSARHIPTYGEVTGPSSRKGKDEVHAGTEKDSEPGGNNDVDEGAFDEDEFEEIADAFESSYNFRFEEPDAAVIKTYPRSLPSLVRREDTSRKEARERRKERKQEELLGKREEVKRLKALKMKEIRAKLERIGREGGKNFDDTEALQDLDLDADWDPVAHDKQMAEIYGDDEDGADAEKPHWDDDIDIDDILPTEKPEPTTRSKKKKKKKKGESLEEEGINIDEMDADVMPAQNEEEEEEWDGTEEMRKRKLHEYMDEIFGLDFNDVVGGMPTRFRYTAVQPQSFSLAPAEILMATDVELNQYLSVKKYAPYRKEGRWDQTRRDRLNELKQRVKEREGAWEESGAAATERPTKKRKGKKERMREKDGAATAETADGVDGTHTLERGGDSVGEDRKRKETVDGGAGAGEPHERSVDGGSRKRKRKRRKGAEAGVAD